MAWANGPLVGLDFETTGIDPVCDLPVQMALVWSDATGVLAREVFIVDPEIEIPPGAIAVHGISTERARLEGRTLEATARLAHRALSDAMSEGVPVVAMNASFDITIAECLFQRFELTPLSWTRVVDPLVIDRHVDRYRRGKRCLDALCDHYGVMLRSAHDAGSDAEATVMLARAIGRTFCEAGGLEAEELTVFERAWHREWATHYDEWRRCEGRSGLPPEDFRWPLRLDPATRAPGVGAWASAGSAPRAESEAGHGLQDQSRRVSRTMSMSSSVERGLTMASRMATLPW